MIYLFFFLKEIQQPKISHLKNWVKDCLVLLAQKQKIGNKCRYLTRNVLYAHLLCMLLTEHLDAQHEMALTLFQNLLVLVAVAAATVVV